jgi:hypothetical protein
MERGFEEYAVYVKIPRVFVTEGAELTRNLTYHTGTRTITAKRGFITDFASVPRILWPMVSPLGKVTLPSIIHDWCYTYGWEEGISRKEADKIFYNAMRDCNISAFSANIIWASVRLFARKHYISG